MLPSKQRLTRQQFTTLLKNPELKVIFNAVGTLKYVKVGVEKQSGLKDGKPGPFSVVTGSKHKKRAVLRNKFRRRVYTLFSKNPYEINISGVLYASKQVYDMPYDQIKTHLNALLSKINK